MFKSEADHDEIETPKIQCKGFQVIGVSRMLRFANSWIMNRLNKRFLAFSRETLKTNSRVLLRCNNITPMQNLAKKTAIRTRSFWISFGRVCRQNSSTSWWPTTKTIRLHFSQCIQRRSSDSWILSTHMLVPCSLRWAWCLQCPWQRRRWCWPSSITFVVQEPLIWAQHR